MTLDRAYTILYSCVLAGFSLLILAMLIRAVKGPRITDRILSINMIGTMVISCIAICSNLLGEAYLLDVALIYALVSFVSVLIFARIYIPLRPQRSAFGPGAFSEIHPSHEKEETVHEDERRAGRKAGKGARK